MDWLNDPQLDRSTAPVRPSPRPRLLLVVIAVATVIVAALAVPRLMATGSSTPPAAVSPAPSTEAAIPATPAPAQPATTGPTQAAEPSETSEPEYLPSDAQSKLLSVAEGAMKAFARPAKKVTAKAWLKRLTPWLTGEAAEVYSSTDPRNVPFTRLTGTPVLGPISDESELTRSVDVGTDAGTYRVHISMLDYKVEAFQPMDQ